MVSETTDGPLASPATRLVDIEHTVTYLEMTDRAEHHRAPRASTLHVRSVSGASTEWRETLRRVGERYHWSLTDPLSDDTHGFWLIEAQGEVIGVIAIEPQPAGDVEITHLGLLPEAIGQGYGAAALSRALDLGWDAVAIGDQSVQRVWLHTSTLDHPHALRNYEERGLRPFANETRTRRVEVQEQD